jgi:hypothetical protein
MSKEAQHTPPQKFRASGTYTKEHFKEISWKVSKTKIAMLPEVPIPRSRTDMEA